MLKKPLFAYIALIVIISIGSWAPFFWRRSSYPQRCAIIYLVEMALSALAEYLMGIHGIHNIWVIHISTIIEFIVLLAMFYLWEKNIYKKRVILMTGCVFVLIWFIAKNTFESFGRMDIYTSIIAQTIYIVCAVSLLFNVFKDSRTVLKNDARVWIASGLIIYSAGTLVVVSLFDIIISSMPELLNMIWHINWSLVILIVLFFTRGIWCREPREQSRVPSSN